MELFESDQPHPDQQQAALSVEPEPRYQPEQTAVLPTEPTEHGYAWARIVAGTLLAIALVILIVLFARFVYHRTHHNDSTVKRPSSSSSPKVSSGSSSQPNASPSPQPKASSPSPAPAPSPSPATSVPNTGPGNVVGIFVSSSLAAAGLHFIVRLRRLNKATI